VFNFRSCFLKLLYTRTEASLNLQIRSQIRLRFRLAIFLPDCSWWSCISHWRPLAWNEKNGNSLQRS